MSLPTQIPLWDKIINLTLLQSDGESAYIGCPPVGRKPTINVSGKMVSSDTISDIDVRVTNLFTGDTPLSAYKYLKIEAGYRNALRTTIQCEVNNAYQETPGPDGITVFKAFLGGWTDWTNVTLSNNWPVGTSVNTILNYLAGLLNLTLNTSIPDSLETQTPWSATGLVKDFINKIRNALTPTLNIYPSGPFLIATQTGGNTGVIHDLNYFITPPRHEAYGFNLTAPWDPTIRPNDVITVNTKYMRQTYGGSQVGSGVTQFTVQTLSFDFGTTDDANSMIILATDSPS